MDKKQNNNEKFEFASEVYSPSNLYTPSGKAINNIIDAKGPSNGEFVRWGDDNRMPERLWNDYLSCSNLQSIINTMMDYINGEGIKHNFLFRDIIGDIQNCILDYLIFGGFALEGIRNKNKDIVVLKWQNVMNVRVNEDLTFATLSNKWQQFSCKDPVKLPLFKEDELQDHFLFYFRGGLSRGINPVPLYVSALKSVETLNGVRNFHLRNLENNFSGSVILSLNNGTIKQRELGEIRDKLQKQHCGSENAGKIIILNSQDKDHAPTLERLDSDNFGDLYQALSTSSVDDLYQAFRINKVLIGANIATGFAAVEYQNIYALYNRTVILPLQQQIKQQFEKLGVSIEFSEFKIEWTKE